MPDGLLQDILQIPEVSGITYITAEIRNTGCVLLAVVTPTPPLMALFQMLKVPEALAERLREEGIDEALLQRAIKALEEDSLK